MRIYNLGFAIFTIAAIALSFDPFHLGGGAVWLICWRVIQGIGGAMLMACSAAILTDAFPSRQRGMALGVNQVAAIAGQFLGLLIGGLLSEWDWRAVFWVGVPLGVGGTVWSFRSLREVGVRTPARLDWPGTVLFGVGLTVLLAAITYGIQPYGGHPTGWTNPWVLGSITLAVVALVTLYFVESRAPAPMLDIRLFRSKPFALGNLAGLMASVGRGGLQFMLIIWLQGIWLPLHGYSFESTPLWSGIYMLPMTLGFLLAGPLSGTLLGPLRLPAVHHRRSGADGDDIRGPDPYTGGFRLPGVRRADLPQRRGRRHLHRRPTPRRSCPACQPPSAAPPRVSVRRSPTPACRYRSAFSSR